MTNVDFAINWARSTQGHDLYKLCWARVHDATYQVLLKSVQQFKRIGFSPYMGMAAILAIYTNFDSLFLRIPHIKFGFDWSSGS